MMWRIVARRPLWHGASELGLRVDVGAREKEEGLVANGARTRWAGKERKPCRSTRMEKEKEGKGGG